MVPIGAASRQSGVHIETIRYYERTGVIAAPGRTTAGRRSYAPVEIARLRFIRRCRDLGFPLEEIRSLLKLGAQDPSDCAEVRHLAESQIADIREKIARLHTLETALAELIGACQAGHAACPMLTALFSDGWR